MEYSNKEDLRKCYSVTCKDACGVIYDVGVITDGVYHAMQVAHDSLLEGRHINAKPIAVIEVNAI